MTVAVLPNNYWSSTEYNTTSAWRLAYDSELRFWYDRAYKMAPVKLTCATLGLSEGASYEIR
jgi:hypothetical protein